MEDLEKRLERTEVKLKGNRFVLNMLNQQDFEQRREIARLRCEVTKYKELWISAVRQLRARGPERSLSAQPSTRPAGSDTAGFLKTGDVAAVPKTTPACG